MSFLNRILLPGPREGPEYRHRVEWLVFLRLLVTSFLLLLTAVLQYTLSRSFLGDPATPLYIIFGTTYVLSLLYALALPRISHLATFSFIQIMIDTVYVAALVAFTGGASSAFILLYLFPIIAAGVLHYRRGALVAASASCVIFGLLVTLQFYRVLSESPWPWLNESRNHDPGFVLWTLILHFIVFFFVAVLAGSVAQQLATTKISLGLREVAFEKLSELHTNIVESISSGIITTDEKDRITFVNVPGTSILGVFSSELLQAPLGRFFPDILEQDLLDPAIKAPHVVIGELLAKSKTIEYRVTELKDREGKHAGRLIVFQDVTEIRKLEERAKLHEKQDSFVRIAAGMAHEIRNPLASLRGAAELLSQPVSDSAHQMKLLSIVIRESDRLNSLLSDFILTVNSSPTHKLRLCLGNLVHETVELTSGQLHDSYGITVRTSIARPVEIAGEPKRLKQALRNLLSNAAESSPYGSVLRVSLQAEGHQAVLSVQDSGPGIPPNNRSGIFEPFSGTRDSGTGLGLPMVLSVVEAHHGTIEVQDGENGGAVFVIRFPLASQVDVAQVGEKIHA